EEVLAAGHLREVHVAQFVRVVLVHGCIPIGIGRRETGRIPFPAASHPVCSLHRYPDQRKRSDPEITEKRQNAPPRAAGHFRSLSPAVCLATLSMRSCQLAASGTRDSWNDWRCSCG